MILLALIFAGLSRAPAENIASREAYLMGTRVGLSARAEDRRDARATLENVLRSLEQTENDLSTWRDTPFNRLNQLRENATVALDPRLCDLIAEIDAWSRRTDGAFDPAVGPLVDLWGVERRARIPGTHELQQVLPHSRLSAWRFDSAHCTITRPSGGRLDAGAFGKGEAIDRARHLPVSAPWLVDLGGQIGVGPGFDTSPTGGWVVGIAEPRRRDRALFEVMLRGGSLATSGGSERDRHTHGRRVGHIMDPRTGRPARFDGSVVVWHERGLVADILSTALYVMGPAHGLEWAERNGIAACFLIPKRGRVRVSASSAFRRQFGAGLRVFETARR